MEMEAERLKSIYAFYSYFYDGLFGRLYAPGRKAAISLMNIRQGEEVLEVGVGTGIALPLYPREACVVGVDISREMLDMARQRKRDFGLSNVELYEMDATKMDFPSGRFHKVIAAHTLGLVPEPLRLVREMKRVCREGGEIYVLNYAGSTEGLTSQIEKFISPFRRTLGLGQHLDIEAILKESGLKIEYQQRVNVFGSCCLIKCRR